MNTSVGTFDHTTGINDLTDYTTASYDLTRFIILESAVALFTVSISYLTAALLCFEWRKSQLDSVHPQARAQNKGRPQCYSCFECLYIFMDAPKVLLF